MVTLYVYYRVAQEVQAEALVAARAMQAAVAADTGCQTALSQRRDDGTTWMETYAGVRDDALLRRSLAHHLAHSSLPSLLGSSVRHEEWFIPL